MKLEQLIAKLATDALVGLGALDKPKLKLGRPKGSKNKPKIGRPKGSKNKNKDVLLYPIDLFTLKEWHNVKVDLDKVIESHLKKRKEKK